MIYCVFNNDVWVLNRLLTVPFVGAGHQPLWHLLRFRVGHRESLVFPKSS